MRLRVLALLLLASLAGCDLLVAQPRTIRLAAGAPILKQDESIIAARLAEHTPSLSRRFEMKAGTGELLVQASGSPQEGQIHYLLSHRGTLVARSATGRAWFSQDDVVDARAGFDEQQRTVLNLRLSGPAASQVARLSAEGIGQVILVDFDGQPLAAARVSAPIPEGALQLTIDRRPEEALLIATILRSGHLSFVPGDIRVEAQR